MNILNFVCVICFGDSFDDDEVEFNMFEDICLWIVWMIVGCNWIWIIGNYDLGFVLIGGIYLVEVEVVGLIFCYIV